MAWTVTFNGVDLVTATWNDGMMDQFSVSAPLHPKDPFPVAEFAKDAIGKRDEEQAKVADFVQKAPTILADIEAALNGK